MQTVTFGGKTYTVESTGKAAMSHILRVILS
jgi:hypothetical protein